MSPQKPIEHTVLAERLASIEQRAHTLRKALHRAPEHPPREMLREWFDAILDTIQEAQSALSTVLAWPDDAKGSNDPQHVNTQKRRG